MLAKAIQGYPRLALTTIVIYDRSFIVLATGVRNSNVHNCTILNESEESTTISVINELFIQVIRTTSESVFSFLS
jgi:hypothetical protein